MKRLCSVNKVFPSEERAEGTHYSEWLYVGSLHELLVLVDITAVSSAPPGKLSVTFETSPNALDDYAFRHTTVCNQLSSISKQIEVISNFGKFVRLKADVTGTNSPTVTFEAFIVAKS